MPVKFHLELSLTAVLTDGIIPDKFLPYLDWLCDSFQQHLFPIRGWSDLLKEVRILTQSVVKPETKKKNCCNRNIKCICECKQIPGWRLFPAGKPNGTTCIYVLSEERAHSLGTESPRCVLGHIMRVDIFVNDEKAFADGQIDD